MSWRLPTSNPIFKSALCIAMAAFGLSACVVVNDAKVVDKGGSFKIDSGRSILIIGLNQPNDIDNSGFSVVIDRDEICWPILNKTINQMTLIYSPQDRGTKYFFYEVSPGLYHYNYRPDTIIQVPLGKIVYVGDFQRLQGALGSKLEIHKDLDSAAKALENYKFLNGDVVSADVRVYPPGEGRFPKVCGLPKVS